MENVNVVVMAYLHQCCTTNYVRIDGIAVSTVHTVDRFTSPAALYVSPILFSPPASSIGECRQQKCFHSLPALTSVLEKVFPAINGRTGMIYYQYWNKYTKLLPHTCLHTIQDGMAARKGTQKTHFWPLKHACKGSSPSYCRSCR